MLAEGKVDECDIYLQHFLTMDFSTLLQVGFTRITKPYKDIIKTREELTIKLKQSLEKVCSTQEEIDNVFSHVV